MRLKSFLGNTFKILFKIGVATAGATAYTNPISGTIAGAVAVASAVSSAIKDKKLGKLEAVINSAACNIDEASNDIKKNYHN